MDRNDLNKVLTLVRSLDIGKNPEPAAIFDPLLQGFNIWAIPSDHPGGDWDEVMPHSIAGAFSKRCEYVGCAFWNPVTQVLTLTTDAYAFADIPHTYEDRKSIHNLPADIEWCKQKIQWVFERAGVECPPIVVGEDE